MAAVKTRHNPLLSKQVGLRLQEARESKGLKPESVGSLLRISGTIITQIEEGEIEKYLKEIYGMLCIYTIPVHQIFEGYFNAEDLPNTSKKTDINDCISYVLDSINFHKTLMGRSSALSILPFASGKINGKSTIFSKDREEIKKKKSLKKAIPSILESRAKEVIQQHGLHKLPINVYQVAANLGVSVSFESLPSEMYMKIKGFCYKDEEFSLIGVNKSHPISLQRFTMAHELHHLLYDFNAIRFLCGPDNAEEAFEWNAEHFAAELLMPRDLMLRLISNPLNINYLTVNLVAKHFGVSYEAAAIRLNKFGLIQNHLEVCKKDYREKDKKKTEYLIQHKRNHLTAVFGLETGIPDLQSRDQFTIHELCGAPITDPSHTICWHCGLELQGKNLNDSCLKNPYRQNPSNLFPTKALSFEIRQRRKENEDYNQLSINLNCSI
jgi:Zn-dependent peptidase ImmA (M78 family)/transcriptional regulator with XRE-family HTH domain